MVPAGTTTKDENAGIIAPPGLKEREFKVALAAQVPISAPRKLQTSNPKKTDAAPARSLAIDK